MARVPEIIRRNPLSQVAPQGGQVGQGWAALADLAAVGTEFVKPAAKDQARQQGEKSVYRDEDGNLKVDERSLYSGEMGAVQNQAAFAKYLSQKSIDINSTMAELSVKYEFDPGGFKAATDAYVKTLQDDPNVPSVLKEDVVRSVEEGASRSFNGLQRREVDRTYKAADTQSSTARDMLMNDYVSLYVEGDEEGAAAKWKEIEELSRMRGNAPYIAETPAETEAFKRGVRGTAKAARLLRDLSDLEGADEISDKQRSEMNELLKDPDISPGARQSLYAATQGRLKSIDAAGIVKGLTNDSFEAKVSRLSGIAVGGAQRGDSFTGMNDQFVSGLDAMISAAPESVQKNLKVSSGFRSVARQKELWAGALKKYGSVAEARKSVAPPGKSQHGHGNAADLKFLSPEAKQWVHQNAGQFGLHFPLSNEDWHIELASARGVTPQQRTANQAALSDAGIQVSDANEFLALTFGAGKAIEMLNGDDPTAKADIPEDVLAANPEMKGMTVRDVQNWAARKMTMKSSDLAAMSVQIDRIEDPELRKLAGQGLTERINVRRNIEDAAMDVFVERIATGDVSLTAQEISETHDLSTDDQINLTAALNKANDKADEMRQFVVRMNDPDGSFNPLDSGDKKGVDKVYEANVGDEPATSDHAVNVASSIAKRTGIIPKKAAGAIRAATSSDDSAAVGGALEILARLKADAGGSLASVTGAKSLENMLSDYQAYGQFMSSEEAAQRMISNREKKPKNVTDEAKEQAKKLDISDVTDRFDRSIFSDPKVGDSRADAKSTPLLEGPQENEMMAEYTKLFKDAYADTGDFDLAQNRSLDEMSRIYGMNEVSGQGRVMKYPPQKLYPTVAGAHSWMREQLVSEVNEALLFDRAVDEAVKPGGTGDLLLPGGETSEFGQAPETSITGKLAEGLAAGTAREWVKYGQIALVSDAQTAAQAKSGRPASYIVYAMKDGELHQLPKRFAFDPSAAKAEAHAKFKVGRADAMNDAPDRRYYRNVERYGQEQADQMLRESRGTTQR